MSTSKRLVLVGRAALLAAGMAALVGTSAFAFDGMSAEQKAALQAAQVAQADVAAEPDAAAGEAGGERTIFDGVYTQEQADRGEGFFSSDCAS